MAYENIQLEVEDGIAVLTVSRPKVLNALDTRTLTELAAALGELDAREGLRALIVTGGGEKAFVAGADVAEMAGYGAHQAGAFSALGHRVGELFEALRVPSIAAVNGIALGGGLELALCCDLIYASEKARLGFPEVSLAVIPGFGGTQRLSRRVGRSRAKELVLGGEVISAQRAREIGLVLDVLAPEALMDHCHKLARKIAERGPLAIAQAKRVIDRGADADLRTGNELERQAFSALFGTQDQKEGMAAFLEKRPPKFQGR